MKKEALEEYFKDQHLSLSESLLVNTIGAIAHHPKLKEKIDERYASDSVRYFSAYENSHYYRYPYLRLFPASDEIRMIKLLSMYLGEENTEIGRGKTLLMDYILDGYKRVYDYVSRHQTLSFSSFLAFYLERESEEMPEPIQTLISGMVLYLCDDTIDIVPPQIDPVLRTVLYNLTYNEVHTKKDNEFETEKKKNEFLSLQHFQSTTGIKVRKSEILDNVMSRVEEQLVKKLSKKEKEELMKKASYQNLYNKGLYRYWKPLTTLLRINEINDMNFSLINITREDILDIYSTFTLSKKMKRLNEEEYEFFLTSSLVILMLIKQYKLLREEYVALFEEKGGKEEIQKKKRFQEEKQQFQEKEKAFKLEIAHLQEKAEALEKEVQHLKSEKKKSDIHEHQYEQLKKEVIALRKYAFEKEKEKWEEDENQEEAVLENIKKLQDKKIAIIGGHEKWHQKIKEALPHVRTVHPDELGVDLHFLRNMDMVCIVTSYNNHSLYHKALSYLDKKETVLLYMNQQPNLTYFVKQLNQLNT